MNAEVGEYIINLNPITEIELDSGQVMTVELFPQIAPISVSNFIEIVNSGTYTNLTFHRVIEGFIIQRGQAETQLDPIGEFSSNGIEHKLKHVRVVISMTKTFIMNSDTSQFFIMHQDSPYLDGSYAAFGYLLNGYDVFNNIAITTTNYNDQPLTDILIKLVTIRDKELVEINETKA